MPLSKKTETNWSCIYFVPICWFFYYVINCFIFVIMLSKYFCVLLIFRLNEKINYFFDWIPEQNWKLLIHSFLFLEWNKASKLNHLTLLTKTSPNWQIQQQCSKNPFVFKCFNINLPDLYEKKSPPREMETNDSFFLFFFFSPREIPGIFSFTSFWWGGARDNLPPKLFPKCRWNSFNSDSMISLE